MIPVFKKENALLLKNYRPISVLPIVSKIWKNYAEADFRVDRQAIISPLMWI